jgi:prepilin-type processing-associated H-X9-DG protein
MNAMPTVQVAALTCLAALLAPVAGAKPAAHKPVAHKPTLVAAPSPAVALVRQYLAARANGQVDKAYALLSASTQAEFPASKREQIARSLMGDPALLKNKPPALVPFIALIADIHNTLHFKFRVLGPSPDDSSLVLVRAYQVGTPLSTIKVLQIATAPDPAAPDPGALRLDGIETASLSAPEMMRGMTKAAKETSQYYLEQLARVILQYAQDHDEKLPDADRWVDEIMPYVKSQAFFRDPSAPEQEWSYAFNRALSGVRRGDIKGPAATVLVFESTAGVKNAADTGDSVPVPGRYDGGTDYAFADGHVMWASGGAKPSFLLTGK